MEGLREEAVVCLLEGCCLMMVLVLVLVLVALLVLAAG